MAEIDGLRAEIDRIDRELTALLEQRLDVTAQVARYKLERDLPVLDAARERQVIASKRALLQRPEHETAVTSFFEAVMAISRRQQRGILAARQGGHTGPVPPETRAPLSCPRILFQGEAGAYGEEAAVRFFGEGAHMDHAVSFEDVFRALKDGRADYGVLPLENNSTGAITDVYDLFFKYGCYIVGEQVVPVRHCLMAPKGAALETVSDVYSHAQGFFQSRAFFERHPHMTQHQMQNTAAAAKYVAEANHLQKAAVGSLRAARLYGLSVLAERINDEAGNGTRFVVLSKLPEQRPGSDKMSVLFKIPHESGSLHRILEVLAAQGLNLLKLESRPIAGREWEYAFFLDFSGDWNQPNVQAAMAELEEAATLQILGNYKGAVTPMGEGRAR